MQTDSAIRAVKSRRIARRGILGDRFGPDIPISSVRLHATCIVVALTAAVIFTLTEHDDHRHTIWCAVEIAVQTVLVLTATAYFRARVRVLHDSSVIMPALVMIVVMSLICEPVQRLLFDHGHAFEILVMHSQCNLMLALAVCGFRVSFQRLTVVIAVFLTLFSCTISNAPGLLPLTAFFAAACLAWLVVGWWETVDRRLLPTERRRIPGLRLAALAGIPLLLLLTSAGFGANTVTTALRGFLPGSGGTGRFDPFSRGGVNDGDALVAASRNVRSFAALEDAPFMDSEKPSLYDVLNDTFDEPVKITKQQQRAVALSADLLEHVHRKISETRKAGREFSMVRSPEAADVNPVGDSETPALFYIAGRTPAHFRMEVYEYFDGTTWYPLEDEEIQSDGEIRTVDKQAWLDLPVKGRALEIFSGSMTHSIKVVNLDGNVIPAPLHLAGVCIDQVAQRDFYAVYTSGLVSLQRDSLPPLTAIHTVSECVDPERLQSRPPVFAIPREGDLCGLLPETTDKDRIGQLAEEWTKGIPRGWQQVDAVVDRLRQEYTLDRNRKVDPDSESPIDEFLFRQRSGPEYLFAGSAACLLRSLGYKTRLVSGFYARPERYDSRSQHTPVLSADAHIWCEVLVGLGAWLTVEASPGYKVCGPPAGLLSQFVGLFREIVNAAKRHALLLTAAGFAGVVGLARRRSIREFLLTLRWRLSGDGLPRRRALRLAVLVDQRMRLAGFHRSSGVTLRRWVRGRQSLAPLCDDLLRLAEIADEAAFGPKQGILGIHPQELDRLATKLSYQQLRRLHKRAAGIGV